MRLAISTAYKSPPRVSAEFSDYRIHVLVLAIVLIGNVIVPLGSAKITLFPLLWALILGTIVSIFGVRLPRPVRIGTRDQTKSAAVIQIAVFLFISKLGLIVGQSLPTGKVKTVAFVFFDLRAREARFARGNPASIGASERIHD